MFLQIGKLNQGTWLSLGNQMNYFEERIQLHQLQEKVRISQFKVCTNAFSY